jgi:uncharacterized membrane protein YebE (DUF533 family)
MIDVNKLLTQVLSGSGQPGQAGAAGTGGFLDQARKSLQSGDLSGLMKQGQDMLRGGVPVQATGQGQTGAAPSGGGIGDFLSKNAGGIAAGAAAGVLTSMLFGSKGARKIGSSAIKVGALAAIGGLAWKAYQNYQSGKPVVPGFGGEQPAAPPSQAAETAPQANAHALLLLRSMIAAAAADGMVDASERARIVGALEQVGMSNEEASFLNRELASPVSVEALAAGAATPDQKGEVYLAALLAIEADTAAETAHLSRLAAALGLDAALVAHLTEAARDAKASA